MKTFAILGHLVEHSLSPKLHNAVFKALGLEDREYVFLDCEPENLEKVMQELREGKYEGFSVTIPHKQAVMEYCDEISERAKKIGAVNTLIRVAEGALVPKSLNNPKAHKAPIIIGDNTDYLGFERSLIEKIGTWKLELGTSALVLGSGGVSRAVIAVLRDKGMEVTVASLHPEKKQDLVDDFEVKLSSYEDLDPNDEYSLIVNCTPVGMYCSPDRAKDVKEGPEGDVLLKDSAWYRSDRLYVDVIYNPRVTSFLKRAQEAGAEIVTGDRMFLWQAVEQAKIFTGRDDVPVEVMEQLVASSW